MPLGENSREVIVTSEGKLPINEDEPEPGFRLYNLLPESLLILKSLLSLEKAISLKANNGLLSGVAKVPRATNLPNGSTVPARPLSVITRDDAVPNELVLMV